MLRLESTTAAITSVQLEGGIHRIREVEICKIIFISASPSYCQASMTLAATSRLDLLRVPSTGWGSLCLLISSAMMHWAVLLARSQQIPAGALGPLD